MHCTNNIFLSCYLRVYTAYVHLGQLKLSMSANLKDARGVVALYDKGIQECRTKEESKDICSMRILAQAQVEAAGSLGMDTLSSS